MTKAYAGSAVPPPPSVGGPVAAGLPAVGPVDGRRDVVATVPRHDPPPIPNLAQHARGAPVQPDRRSGGSAGAGDQLAAGLVDRHGDRCAGTGHGAVDRLVGTAVNPVLS